MKITKNTFILLILTLVSLPLFGNENMVSRLHIGIISTALNYLLPLLLILSLLKEAKDQNKLKFKINKQNILLIIFFIFLTLSLIFSVTMQVYTITNYIKILSLVIILILLTKVKYNSKQKKILNYSILSLLVFTCVLGIIQYIFGIDLTSNGIEKYPGALGRVKSTFYITTLFDKYLTINIIYILYLIKNNCINKYLGIAIFILTNITIALTFSRTALIVLLFIYIILFIYFIVIKKYIISIFIVLVLIINSLIPGQNYLYSSCAKYFKNITESIEEKTNIKITNITNIVLDRFIIEYEVDVEEKDPQLTEDIDYSLNSRKYFRNVATEVMISNPIFGIGIGSYNYIYDKQNASKYINDKSFKTESEYLYPHNMYVHLGSEIGIIGMLLFFIIIIYIMLKKKDIFNILLLISILLSCYTESIFYMKDIAIFVIIIISILSNKYSKTNC